ncbi:MAG: hypothetical protein ACYTF9_06355 [Planctomycetota bacterium]|jgi:hypothetical protein
MSNTNPHDELQDDALRHFTDLVESVGVKRFSKDLGISTRQTNRILAGVQPNPVLRLIRSLQAADADTGDRVIDYICQELGGHFVRHEAIEEATVNAVKECAEAIAAISDGQISDIDIQEVREAISALSGLVMSLRRARDSD